MINPASNNFIVQKYNSKGGLLWENIPFEASAGDRSFYDIVFLFDNYPYENLSGCLC